MGSGFGRSPGTTVSPRKDWAVFPGGYGRGQAAGFGSRPVRDQKPGRNARGQAASELAQQVVVPGVALLAVFPLDVNGIAYPSGLQHRIRHRKKGENGELEQSEGDDAKSARIPQASGYVLQ